MLPPLRYNHVPGNIPTAVVAARNNQPADRRIAPLPPRSGVQSFPLPYRTATKSNKALPEFTYANDSARRDRFLATADRDIAKAKEQIGTFEQKAAAAKDDVKVKLEKQNVGLHQDLKAAEDKLAEMRRASELKWKQFEADVSRKIAHLRQSLEKSTG